MNAAPAGTKVTIATGENAGTYVKNPNGTLTQVSGGLAGRVVNTSTLTGGNAPTSGGFFGELGNVVKAVGGVVGAVTGKTNPQTGAIITSPNGRNGIGSGAVVPKKAGNAATMPSVRGATTLKGGSVAHPGILPAQVTQALSAVSPSTWAILAASAALGVIIYRGRKAA